MKDILPMKQNLYFILKRFIDLFLSALSLLLLSPLCLIVALLIKLDSPGPVLFSQYRVGKQGKIFKMYKFRSMFVDAEQRQAMLMANNEMIGGVTFKMKNDPRVTTVGRIIRKLSIDEIPQIINVFKGDMSLVGPRPPLPKEVEKYTLYQYQRLAVKPGITCTWQISGRSELSFRKQVELDLYYIAHQTILFDILILLKTMPAVLKARGAY
jgi:exopolysaccharide biosynthesis polyprenyl glycosylphosphotransferase